MSRRSLWPGPARRRRAEPRPPRFRGSVKRCGCDCHGGHYRDCRDEAGLVCCKFYGAPRLDYTGGGDDG